MPEQVRGRLLRTLWGMLGLCLMIGLGCQAQVAYSILSGDKPADGAVKSNGPSEPGMEHAVDAKVPPEFLNPAGTAADSRRDTGSSSGIVRTGYQESVALETKGPPAPLSRVSVMPEFQPTDESFSTEAPAPAPALPPKVEGQSLVKENPSPGMVEVTLYGQGETLPAPATYGQPTALPAITEQPEVKQADGPRLPDLPEVKSNDPKVGPSTITVSATAEVMANEQAPAPAKMPPPREVPPPPVQGPVLGPPPAVVLAPLPGGCRGPGCGRPQGGEPAGEGPMPVGPPPHELNLVSHPAYMIEPPDILLIDAIRLVPRPPYVVQPLDVLLINVTETLPNQPIAGAYVVAPDGTVSLGFSYGAVRVAGMSLEQVQEVIRQQLLRTLKNPQVSIGLGQFRGMQQLRGEHLVRQDGTISLGTYGCVYLTGLTICQARAAIERHLSQFLVDPEISVDIFAYNSKVYYIIADGAGFGQQVFRFPITGKETVLDAIANIQGLPVVASKKHIWVARPAPACQACVQVLPVDWLAITQGGSTATNYQLFPGDRIYIKSDCLIHFDNVIAKIVSPIERLLGVTLLGTTTVQSFRNINGNNTGTTGFIVP